MQQALAELRSLMPPTDAEAQPDTEKEPGTEEQAIAEQQQAGAETQAVDEARSPPRGQDEDDMDVTD